MSHGNNSRNAFKQPFADLAASVELGLIRTLDAERQEAEQGLQARTARSGGLSLWLSYARGSKGRCVLAAKKRVSLGVRSAIPRAASVAAARGFK